MVDFPCFENRTFGECFGDDVEVGSLHGGLSGTHRRLEFGRTLLHDLVLTHPEAYLAMVMLLDDLALE